MAQPQVPMHVLPKYFGAYCQIASEHPIGTFEELRYSEKRFYKRAGNNKITACKPFQETRKFHEHVEQYRICVYNTYQNTHTYYNIYLLGYMGEGNERYNLYVFPRNFTQKYLKVKANYISGQVTDINPNILQSKMLEFPSANGITLPNTIGSIPHETILLRSSSDYVSSATAYTNTLISSNAVKTVAKPVRSVPPQYVVDLMVADAIVKGETCPILYDPLTKENTVVTSCFHLFSREAFADWRKKSKECPKCREECVVTA